MTESESLRCSDWKTVINAILIEENLKCDQSNWFSAAGSYALKPSRFVRQSAIDNHLKSYGRAPEITAIAANTNRSPATLLTKKNTKNKQVKPKGQGWKLAPATSQMRVILCCGG